MTQQQVLIDAQVLRSMLDRKDWVVVDSRFDLGDVTAGRRDYERGHIPGAVFLDLDLDLAGPVQPETGRHPLPDAGQISNTLGQLGIGSANTVVVYDGGNGATAARAWWILRWLGLESVHLLNGGYAQWKDLDLPVDDQVIDREGQAFEGNPVGERVLTTAELASDLAGIESLKLLDARDQSRFRGEQEPIDPVAGHIPGALNLPFADFVNQDGTWRPLAQRSALIEAALGNDREMPWSVMCGSGVTACHLAISGLEAGFSEPRLYVGSWSEWIRDPERPIGTGEG